MEKLMFEFDEEKILHLPPNTIINEILYWLNRVQKAMKAETRPCFKREYGGEIRGLKLALGFLVKEEERQNLKMDFLEGGPF